MATLLGRRPRRPPFGAGPGGAERTKGSGDGASAPVDPGAASPRLVHEPALDGLRGVAVLAVLVFHLDRMRGGFLGVDLFFALSGYLITSLLVVERRTRGGIALGAFWARRARRLLPALFVLVAGVAVLLTTLTDAADRPHYRGDALATLGYVANWERMAAPVSYWDIFRQPSPLDHTWSLAIEEQFYLVWPLVALVVLGGWRAGDERRRPRARAGPAGASGRGGRRPSGRAPARPRSRWPAGSRRSSRSAVLWSPVDTNRAVLRHRRPPRAPRCSVPRWPPSWRGGVRRPVPPSTALDARRDRSRSAGMAVAFLVIDGQGAAYYRAGWRRSPSRTLVVIVAVTGGPAGTGGAARCRGRPLVALGAISYGVYLWHWPVIVYLTPDRLGVRRYRRPGACAWW